MNKINFQITGKCNMDCPFCCDTFKHQKGKNIEEIKRMIDCIPNTFQEINITGGEPLCYPEVGKVLKYIHEKGFKTTLTTNGVYLKEKEGILKYVDKIYLPLNTINPKTSKLLGQETDQMMNIIQNVGLIHSKYPKVEIAINTVLMNQNYQELVEMYGLVQLLDCTEWEIKQFLPHGNGKDNMRKFLLDDRDFDYAISQLKYSDLEDKIIAKPISSMIDNEWTITPDFQMMKLKDYKPSIYKNIFETSENNSKIESSSVKVKRQMINQH